MAKDSSYRIDAVDTMGDNWKKADYTKYDVVFHVAGIAHVNADPKMEPLYYKVNCNLTTCEGCRGEAVYFYVKPDCVS